MYNRFNMFPAELYSQWLELRETHSDLGLVAQNLPYINPLDTLPKIPNRAPNPAISMEYGHLTFMDMSGRFGFISFT